jgi:hypothetical protein
MDTSKLMGLFSNYDDSIQKVILGVLSIEQANISMEKPRVKDEIDNIVSAVTVTVLAKSDSESW